MVDIKEHKRFPRIWPAKFRNRLGDYLMQVSLTGSSFVLYKHGHRMCAITAVQPGAKGVPITPSKYRHHSSEIIARVRWAKERFLIVKRGRKLAWIRPVEDVGIKERESL